MQELEAILEESRASEPFKADARSYLATAAAERVRVEGYAPPVKVARLLKHLLSSEPHLEVDRVAVRGKSGCSHFSGTIDLHTLDGQQRFEFVWDCRWRALKQGWIDCFGLPDQIRAAREFDWRCFSTWRPIQE